MRRIILALLLAMLGGCYTYAPWQPETYNRHWVDWLVSGTKQVRVSCDGEYWSSSGSGVVIQRDDDGTTYFATASHVADEGCEFFVDDEPLELVARDSFYDQAILVGSVPGRVTDESPEIYVGQRVINAGWPLQFYTGRTGFQVTHGNLSAFIGPRYKVTAEAYYGSSGGPCFDWDGDLVGLVVSMSLINDVPVEFHVSPAWRLYELLDEVD